MSDPMNHPLQKAGRAGFTLVEMVIVLAVLAVLAAVAIPQIQQIQRQVELNNVARSLASAAEHSFALQVSDQNGWPGVWTTAYGVNICDALNDLSSNLVRPSENGGSYGIEIPDGYIVAPAANASSEAVTFSVPNATGGSRDSPTTSVLCALIPE